MNEYYFEIWTKQVGQVGAKYEFEHAIVEKFPDAITAMEQAEKLYHSDANTFKRIRNLRKL